MKRNCNWQKQRIPWRCFQSCKVVWKHGWANLRTCLQSE